MPIFEFQCRKCGEKLERILPAPIDETACPRCGKTATRLVSKVSVSGSGDGQSCSAPSGSAFG
ncbi:MAG: FmdB family zinc ribbon protein [Desulfuromonadales bacterium]